MVGSIYAWQEWGPDERWGTIAAVIPAIGSVAPLVVRDLETAMQLEPIAKAHGDKATRKVALRRFEYVETI